MRRFGPAQEQMEKILYEQLREAIRDGRATDAKEGEEVMPDGGLSEEQADPKHVAQPPEDSAKPLAAPDIAGLVADLKFLFEAWKPTPDLVFEQSAMGKAADALERLQNERDYRLVPYSELMSARGALTAAKAEIERLSSPPLQQEVIHLDGQIKELLTENEELRKTLEELKPICEAAVRRQDAEIARLRTALEMALAEFPKPSMTFYDVAIAALKGVSKDYAVVRKECDVYDLGDGWMADVYRVASTEGDQ